MIFMVMLIGASVLVCRYLVGRELHWMTPVSRRKSAPDLATSYESREAILIVVAAACASSL